MSGIFNNEWLNPDPRLENQRLKDTFGGGGSGSSGPSASDLFANATRQEWSDYTNTFVPIENNLIKYATDPTQVSTAMSQAGTDVNNAFTAQQGATQRQLSALGTTLTPEEQVAQTRSSGLTQSLADVQAQNTARDLTTQRQQSILGNPAPQG